MHDEAAFPCDGLRRDDGDPTCWRVTPAQLAISVETARDLVAAGQEGPLPLTGFEAEFLPRPAHLASAGLIEERLSE